jgi:hypothetical protein
MEGYYPTLGGQFGQSTGKQLTSYTKAGMLSRNLYEMEIEG